MNEQSFIAAFENQRAALQRHCYRMLGSADDADDLVQETFERAWKGKDSYAGDAPLERWLYSIATNACLNALKSRKRRELPQLESPPAGDEVELREHEHARWISPLPDAGALREERETVALAFIALLQRLPPKQRATLLMKDVLGYSAEDIARELDQSLPSVNSALHRAREAMVDARRASEEPLPETLAAFMKAWVTRDLEGLVALLRDEVDMAMPPHDVWLHGREAVRRFLLLPRFQASWLRMLDATPLRANGEPAVLFHRATGSYALMVLRFVGDRVAEMTVFIGEQFLPRRLS